MKRTFFFFSSKYLNLIGKSFVRRRAHIFFSRFNKATRNSLNLHTRAVCGGNFVLKELRGN